MDALADVSDDARVIRVDDEYNGTTVSISRAIHVTVERPDHRAPAKTVILK